MAEVLIQNHQFQQIESGKVCSSQLPPNSDYVISHLGDNHCG